MHPLPIYLGEGLASFLQLLPEYVGLTILTLSPVRSLSAQLSYIGGNLQRDNFFPCIPFPLGGEGGMKRKLWEKREAPGIPGKI